MLQIQSFLARDPSAFWLTRSQTQLCCPLKWPGAILGNSALLRGDTGKPEDCTLPLQQSEKCGIVTLVTHAQKKSQISRIKLNIFQPQHSPVSHPGSCPV